VTIEIKKPEFETLIQERLTKGTFPDVETLLFEALKSAPERQPITRKSRTEAIAHIRQSRRGNHLPAGIKIKDLINEGRA
jgi:hypothetical protein